MKKTILIFFAFFWMINAYTQNVAINNNGAVPNTNAMLDVDVTTNDMGILIPRLTTAQRTGIGGLGAADEGLTVYDQTTNSYWLWDGTQWVEFGMYGDDWALLGNAGTNPTTNFLGTTDAQDLVFRTNNTEKMRVESGGDVGIGINNPVYKLDIRDGSSSPDIGLTDGTSFLIISTDKMRFNRNDNYSIGSGSGYSGITSFGEIITMEGLTHDVGIGTTTPPYRLTVADALNAAANESASTIVTTASYAFADDDFNREAIFAVQGIADHSTYGRTNYDYGYGVVGSSEIGFESSIGVFGSLSNTIFTNVKAGMASVYDAERYSTISQANIIFNGQYLNDYNGFSFSSYLRMDNNYNSSTIGKYGMYIENIGNYGIKYGINLANNGIAERKYGVLVNLDNAAVTDNTNGVVYYGRNANTQGWGMLIASMGETPAYIAGGGGIFSKSKEYPVIGVAANTDGTAVLGMGQNVPSIYHLADGSGVSGGGRKTGVYGLAINVADGTGGVFVGNDAGASTLVNGSGVAGTGVSVGVYGHATSSSGFGTGSFGGYFTHGGTAYAYVGGRQGVTNYKILGSGSVSTIVNDQNEEPVIMYCTEAPEILFQDYGTGKLVNGKAYIKMDPIFTKNIHVDKDNPIKVFVQLEGDCKGVYVTNKTAEGFEVVELQGGTSNVPFSWTVTATRADSYDESGNIDSKHVGIRFPRGPKAMETKTLETTESQTQEDSDEKYIIEDDKEREVEEIKFEKIK